MDICARPSYRPPPRVQNLCDFEDQLLARVVFGYCTDYWPDLLRLLLVNKRFSALGLAYINRVSVQANPKVSGSWLCATLPRMACRLSSLKLDFTLRGDVEGSQWNGGEAFPSSEVLGALLGTLAPTLTRLSLRGTALDDEAMAALAVLNKGLEMLDVSKSSRSFAPLITDVGIEHLCGGVSDSVPFARMVWLNLAMTRITDESVLGISSNMPMLRHLGLQCCSLLTDDCCLSLESLSLESLDVSSCQQLTDTAFFTLGAKKSNCRASLQHLFASYLPLTSPDLLALLLVVFDRLQVLDFKSKAFGASADENVMPPLDKRQQAKLKLKAAIFTHADSVAHDYSIYSWCAR